MKGVSASRSAEIDGNGLLRNIYRLRHIELNPRFLNSTIQNQINQESFDRIWTNCDMAMVSLINPPMVEISS